METVLNGNRLNLTQFQRFETVINFHGFEIASDNVRKQDDIEAAAHIVRPNAVDRKAALQVCI